MNAIPDAWTQVIPKGNETSARLLFSHGVAPRVDVRGARLDGALARCRFAGNAPTVEAREGELTIGYAGFLRWFFMGRKFPGEVEITDALPWDVEIAGGIAHSTLDLATLDVRRFEVTGGVAHVELRLGKPRSLVPIRIRGGAAHVKITHPTGVGARLRITGGAAQMQLGEQQLGAVGGSMALETRGWSPSGDGYDVKVEGGAAHIAVVPQA